MSESDNSNVVGPRVWEEEDEEDDEDCPLCLVPLGAHDRAHPMQCPSRHCHFNCEFRTFLPDRGVFSVILLANILVCDTRRLSFLQRTLTTNL